MDSVARLAGQLAAPAVPARDAGQIAADGAPVPIGRDAAPGMAAPPLAYRRLNPAWPERLRLYAQIAGEAHSAYAALDHEGTREHWRDTHIAALAQRAYALWLDIEWDGARLLAAWEATTGERIGGAQ